MARSLKKNVLTSVQAAIDISIHSHLQVSQLSGAKWQPFCPAHGYKQVQFYCFHGCGHSNH